MISISHTHEHSVYFQSVTAADRILDASLANVNLLLSKSRYKNAVPGTVDWTKSSNSALVSHLFV